MLRHDARQSRRHLLTLKFWLEEDAASASPSPLRQWQCQERTLFVNGEWRRVGKHQCRRRRRRQAAAIQQLFTRVLLPPPHNYIMRVLETSRREKRRAMGQRNDGGDDERSDDGQLFKRNRIVSGCPSVRPASRRGWTGPIFQRKL